VCLLLRRVKKLALPDLSTLLWALAQLQLQPPDDILSELCERTAPYISSCDVTHLTNIVWALGRLQARPDKEWVEAAEAASMQVGGSDTSGGRGQGGGVESRWGLQARPNGKWVEAAEAASMQVGPVRPFSCGWLIQGRCYGWWCCTRLARLPARPDGERVQAAEAALMLLGGMWK
jgi:hypothetical protein